MSEKEFTLLAWRYATGRLPIDLIDPLWVEVLKKPQRLDLLLIIGGIKVIWEIEAESTGLKPQSRSF